MRIKARWFRHGVQSRLTCMRPPGLDGSLLLDLCFLLVHCGPPWLTPRAHRPVYSGSTRKQLSPTHPAHTHPVYKYSCVGMSNLSLTRCRVLIANGEKCELLHFRDMSSSKYETVGMLWSIYWIYESPNKRKILCAANAPDVVKKKHVQPIVKGVKPCTYFYGLVRLKIYSWGFIAVNYIGSSIDIRCIVDTHNRPTYYGSNDRRSIEDYRVVIVYRDLFTANICLYYL